MQQPMIWSRLELGELSEPRWRDELTQALQQMRAKRLWHSQSGEVQLWWYLIGFRLVKVEWDIWTGLVLFGPERLVERLAARLRTILDPE